jgi:cytochrome c556
MKKIILVLFVAIFAVTVLAFAAEKAKTELRPAQKIMRARAAWLTDIKKNLGTSNFAAIGKDADALAAQTKKVGDGLANPVAKEITLAVSMFATEASAAAVIKDGATVKAKLGAIKGKCDECHAKFRDKKK